MPNTCNTGIRGLAPDRQPEPLEGSSVASVNIKPLEDKMLVQANEAETTTASAEISTSTPSSVAIVR